MTRRGWQLWALFVGLIPLSGVTEHALQYGGLGLLLWLLACLLLALPLCQVEIGLGSSLQGGAPDIFHRTQRKLEWVGWWVLVLGVMLGLLALMRGVWLSVITLEVSFSGVEPFVGSLGESSRLMGEMIGQGSLDPSAQGWNFRPHGGSVLLLGGVCYGLVLFLRHRRETIGTSLVGLASFALFGSLACALVLLGRSGSVQGLEDAFGVRIDALRDGGLWASSAATAVRTVGIGFGLMVTFGGTRPRLPELAGSISTAVCLALAAHIVVLLPLVMAQGVLRSEGVLVSQEAVTSGLGVLVLPYALARLGFDQSLAILALVPHLTMLVLLILSLARMTHTATRRFDVEGGQVAATGIGVAAAMLCLPFVIDGGWAFWHTVFGMLSNFLLPLAAAIFCAAGAWVVGVEPVVDHLRSNSAIHIWLRWRLALSWLAPSVLVLSAFTLFLRSIETYSSRDLVFGMLLPLLLPPLMGIWLSRQREAGSK